MSSNSHPNDDVFDQKDDDHPVTRGEIRKLARAVRNDLRWAVAMTVVANQALSHVEIPKPVGFVGAIAFGGMYLLKGLAARG